MTGSLCISIDLELAWGNWDGLTSDSLRRCEEQERVIVAKLLELLDEHEITATWAIVGSLLKSPSTTLPGNQCAWYAPDLIEQITSCRTTQHIGSHSYSHKYFTALSKAEAQIEIEQAKDIHKTHQLEFQSFVFPRNMVAHTDLLEASGIKVFRSIDHGWHKRVSAINNRLGRVANLLDKIIPFPPSTVKPRNHSSRLVELPSSMLFIGRNGLRRLVTSKALTFKAELGLTSAERTSQVFHLWFHPSNFYFETEKQFEVLGRILQKASKLRADNLLNIRPMEAFANVSTRTI